MALTPYMIPIFLWSTVNIHDRQPVDDTGRRNTPSDVDGVTTGAGAGAGARWRRSGTFDDRHY